MRFLPLLFLPLLLGATVPLGTSTAPRADEDPSLGYRYKPVCRESAVPGVCAAVPTQSWVASVAISSIDLDTWCNAGDNATADPDVNPTHSATGLPSGLSINASTGVISGTPAAGGTGYISGNCTNDLGTYTVTIAYSISPPGVTGTVAAGYFVDCAAGSDLNIGTNPNAPWRRPAMATGLPTGSNVFFKRGVTCDNQRLSVNWGGSSPDPVVIGSYYVSSGVAYIGEPTNYDVDVRPSDYTYADAAAVLQGSYRSSCRNSAVYWGNTVHPDPNKCAHHTADAANSNSPGGAASVPASRYDGMIQVSMPAGRQWITIQDLKIVDSAGAAINVSSGTTCIGSASVCDSNLLIQRVDIDGAASNGIVISGLGKWVVRDSVIAHTDLAQPDSQYHVGTVLREGAGITTPNCWNCQGLIENVDIHDVWGQAIGIYGSSAVIVRGLMTAQTAAGSISAGAGSHIVIEQSIVVAGGAIQDTRALANAANLSCGTNGTTHDYTCLYRGGDGDSQMYYENGGAPTLPSDRVPGSYTFRRNNILVGQNSNCLNQYANASASAGTSVSTWDLGNTCIITSGVGVNYAFATGGVGKLNALGVTNATNMYVDIDAGSNQQCTSTLTTNLIQFKNNFWNVAPADSDCRNNSSTDVVSSNTGLSGFNFATATWSNFPDATDAKPTAGAGSNAGLAFTSTLIPTNGVYDSDIWAWPLSKRTWLPACNTTGAQVSQANWQKGLYFDYCGNTRGGSPDIGAMEF